MARFRIMDRLRAKGAKSEPAPSPETVRAEGWKAELARKDQLRTYMRRRYFGEGLTRDEQVPALREEAIRISQRRAFGRYG